MVDQWWQFSYNTNVSLERLSEQGCSYVPLPITIDRNIKNKWHIKRGEELSAAEGVAITVSCEDIQGALKFINDLLDEEIIKLRYWGIEGKNYETDADGVYYRTTQQRIEARSLEYTSAHFCMYSYFPRVEGMLSDGINAFSPEYQMGEFMDVLTPDVRECLQAYGCESYVDMLGTNEAPGPWYPMYSYADRQPPESAPGMAWRAMNSVKREYLPRVVMTEDFDAVWQQYVESYASCQPEIFFQEMQREVERRIKFSK